MCNVYSEENRWRAGDGHGRLAVAGARRRLSPQSPQRRRWRRHPASARGTQPGGGAASPRVCLAAPAALWRPLAGARARCRSSRSPAGNGYSPADRAAVTTSARAAENSSRPLFSQLSSTSSREGRHGCVEDDGASCTSCQRLFLGHFPCTLIPDGVSSNNGISF